MTEQLREWVPIILAQGQSLREVARALLDLADDPAHVRTASAGNEFLVHPLVAEKYLTPPKPKRAPRKTVKEGDES